MSWPKLVLASASPRRRAMLAGAGIAAEARATDIPETPAAGESPLAFARRAAADKALAGRAALEDPGAFVLASDTVVAVGETILGKPASPGEAAEMLRALSGRTHRVITAFAISAPGEGPPRVGEGIAVVRFRGLSEAEIAAYVASGEPMDKAGAYGIQGGAGAFVESVEGPYDAVVGLPLLEVMDALEAAGAMPKAATPLVRRLAAIRGRIAAAAQAVGRTAEDISIVAVTKTLPAEAVREALALGLTDFGENYVQEWQRKADALGPDVRWHFIGHLQSNKARLLAGRVSAVHALDSVSAATALAKALRPLGGSVDVTVQVNVGGEAQKSGVAPEAAGGMLEALSRLPELRVRGLMTVPPDGALCETRQYFARLRRLRDALATADRPLPWLSMGMSGDFDQAIAEGATHIRLGSALFGARAPKTLVAAGESP